MPEKKQSKIGYIIVVVLLGLTGGILWWHQDRPAWLPQPPKRPLPWNEPDGFMGMRFGENLTQVIPKCEERWYESEQLCWEWGGLSDYYYIRNTQLGNAVAIQLDNKLHHIEITFASNLFAEQLAIFTQRYGKPTSTEVRPWRSKGGAEFTNSTAMWKGEKISINIEERGDKVDQGFATYSTNVWLAHAEQEQKEKIKERAGRL